MAARPKSVAALHAVQNALNNIQNKLLDIANKAERVIAENPHLEKLDVQHYKACAKAATKQLTVLGKLGAIDLPLANDAAAEPKRRGRPPKVKDADAIVAAPKRRGRPPKVKDADVAVEVIVAAKPRKMPRVKIETIDALQAKVEQRMADDAAPRKRGRPKGSKNKPKVVNGSAVV